MDKTPKHFSRHYTNTLDGKSYGWFPIELLIMIIWLVDPATLVKFALSGRWLLQEISNWSKFWERQYCQEFQFNQDYRELYWLQQSVERQRPLNLAITSKDIRTHHHRHRVRKKGRAQVKVDWFRTYCCRQQTEFNLSRGLCSERVISLPSEYHSQKTWMLMAANPRYQVFMSDDRRSLITYRPDNSFGQTKNVSELVHRLTTKNTNKEWDRFCRLDVGKGEEVGNVHADGDAILASDYGGITWFIWPNGRYSSLKVQWPFSSDNDSYTPRKWNVKEIRQGWILAVSNGTNYQRLARIFNIQHARWCGGAIATDECHFQMTTQDIVQVSCYSKLNDHEQWSYQLWEYRTDKTNERCLKSTTFIPNTDKVYSSETDRLNDEQSAIVFHRYNHPYTLTFYRINPSFVFAWKVSMPKGVGDVYFIPTREEMIATTYGDTLYVLNVSDGTILRKVDLPFDTYSLFPVLGSLCCTYDGNVVDTRTGRNYSFREKIILIYLYLFKPLQYGDLCAKGFNGNNQLTLLDWYSQH